MASVASGGVTTNYAYDTAGNPTEMTLPSGNGSVEQRTYDRAGRLTRIKTFKGTTTLADFSYTLDALGNPTQVVRDGDAPGTTSYTYDVRDRLTEVCFQASCPGGSDPFIRWSYDSVGNRVAETRPTGTVSYTYNAADELTAAGSTSYSYDDNGNETAAGSETFTYDLANRITSASIGTGTTTYSYDGDNHRLQASTGSQPSEKTNYLWDGLLSVPQLALERDGSGALLRRYVYGLRRLSMTSGSSVNYYVYDGFGSVANQTAADGSMEWTYAYEPFGATRTETKDDPSAPSNPMKFSGELADTTIGLYYLRAREYDPSLGRLMQRDPVATSSAQPYTGSYEYVANRPTVMADPTGETAQPAAAGSETAAFASAPDTATYLAGSRPPATWYHCGDAECDGIHYPKPGWDEVRGVVKAPKDAFFIYWIRMGSLSDLSWDGAFKIQTVIVKSLWVPAKGIWIHSPVLTGLGVSHPRVYNIHVANLNPHGQVWKIIVSVYGPYQCTKPDPAGFEP